METKVIKEYYKNGRLRFELTRTISGSSHGIQKWYHENGRFSDVYSYIKDIPIGIHQRWYINGERDAIIKWNNLQTGPDIHFNYE
jgi:antitoxin component YwqK of YwqJK toxin-antitoxin module